MAAACSKSGRFPPAGENPTSLTGIVGSTEERRCTVLFSKTFDNPNATAPPARAIRNTATNLFIFIALLIVVVLQTMIFILYFI
jgi:hypothetical protein